MLRVLQKDLKLDVHMVSGAQAAALLLSPTHATNTQVYAGETHARAHPQHPH